MIRAHVASKMQLWCASYSELCREACLSQLHKPSLQKLARSHKQRAAEERPCKTPSFRRQAPEFRAKASGGHHIILDPDFKITSTVAKSEDCLLQKQNLLLQRV